MSNWGKIYNQILLMLAWFKKGFEEESGKPSGKRKSLFALVGYLGYVVIRYTDKHNAVTMAEVLLGGILMLAGVAAYQSVKKSTITKPIDNGGEEG